MNDEELESLFQNETEPNDDDIKTVLKKAKTDVGQKDTLMFAFVNIWVVMAELLAPLFANIAIKNSQSLNPKHKHEGSNHSSNTTDSELK